MNLGHMYWYWFASSELYSVSKWCEKLKHKHISCIITIYCIQKNTWIPSCYLHLMLNELKNQCCICTLHHIHLLKIGSASDENVNTQTHHWYHAWWQFFMPTFATVFILFLAVMLENLCQHFHCCCFSCLWWC